PAARGTRRTFTRFVHAQRSPVEKYAVHLGDRVLRLLLRGHGHEAEPARLPRLAIEDDVYVRDLAAVHREGGAETFFVGGVREISYVETSAHRLKLLRFAAPSPHS